MVEILRGVDAALQTNQYDLVMYSAHTRHSKEATHVARLTRHLAEGLFLVLPQQAQTYLNTLRQLVRSVMLEDGGLYQPREPLTNSSAEVQQCLGWLLEARAQGLEERKATCQKNTGWLEITVEQWAISKGQLKAALLSVGRALIVGERPPLEILAAIRCPLLLVTGDPPRGAMITPEQTAQVLAVQPRARELPLPEAGHCIRFDQPRVYAERVGE